MAEVIVALFAVCIGIVFCFSGYKIMRVLFPIWGLVVGYWLGAELVRAITGDSFLATTLAIMVGIFVALIGAILAYFYYAAAVILFMGSVGFWLGAGLINLIFPRSTVLSTIVGLIVGVVFAFIALAMNLPKAYLLILTAFAGSALIVTGLLILINRVELSSLEKGIFSIAFTNGFFWNLVIIVLGLVGWSAQLVSVQSEELAWSAEWNATTGGK